jgi:hypothetical protein
LQYGETRRFFFLSDSFLPGVATRERQIATVQHNMAKKPVRTAQACAKALKLQRIVIWRGPP